MISSGFWQIPLPPLRALPTSASAAGAAINSRIGTLQTTLSSDLGVTGFTLTPSLPATALTQPELNALLTDPTGPIALRLNAATQTFRGDAEAGTSLTLVDHWDRGAAPWRVPGFPVGAGSVSDRSTGEPGPAARSRHG